MASCDLLVSPIPPLLHALEAHRKIRWHEASAVCEEHFAVFDQRLEHASHVDRCFVSLINDHDTAFLGSTHQGRVVVGQTALHNRGLLAQALH